MAKQRPFLHQSEHCVSSQIQLGPIVRSPWLLSSDLRADAGRPAKSARHIAATLGWDIEPGRECNDHPIGDNGMDAQSTTELATTELSALEAAVDEALSAEPIDGMLPTRIRRHEFARGGRARAALHNQNSSRWVSRNSIHTALQATGGEMLFQMRIENDDCQRVAAVSIGGGERAPVRLVIMPPDGGLMRVEPVDAKQQSARPDRRILCRPDGRFPRRCLSGRHLARRAPACIRMPDLQRALNQTH